MCYNIEMVTRIGEAAPPEPLPELPIDATPFDRSRLTELVTLSSDEYSEHRQNFWQSAQATEAQLTDPQYIAAYRIITCIQDWALFGGYRHTLPPGLVLARHENGMTTVQYDTRLPFPYTVLDEVADMNDSVCHDLVRIREKLFDSHEPEIKAEASRAVRESPAFRLLESFQSETLPEDRHLSEYEKAVRRAGMRGHIALAYGMTAVDHYPGAPDDLEVKAGELHPFDLAASQMQRGERVIEHMTVRDKEAEDDPLLRAQEYFYARIAQDLAPLIEKRAESRGVEGPNTLAKLKTLIADYNTYPYAPRFAESEALRLLDSKSPDDFTYRLNLRILNSAITEMLPARPGSSYPLLLEELRQEAIGYITGPLFYIPHWQSIHQRNPDGGSSEYNRVASSLRLPQGEEVPIDELIRADLAHRAVCPTSHAQNVAYASRLAYEELTNTLDGHIIRRDAKLSDPAYGQRLILSVTGTKRPPLTGQEAVIFDFSASRPFRDGSEPHMPGYRLISRSDQMFGFEPEAHDPYEGADQLSVDPAQAAALASAYRRLGLEDLATLLENSESLSVKGVADAIRQMSEYYLPHFTAEMTIKNLEDASQLVQHGKLRLQCDSAAQLTALSLQRCGIHAYVIAGRSITAKDEFISQAGHSQVAVIDDNTLYIVDPTPTGNTLAAGALANESRPGTLTETIKPEPAASLAPIPPPAAPPERPPQPTPAELLTGSRQRLETYLHSVLREKDQDKLYQRLISLRPGDPLRQVWELAVQATTYDNARTEDLERCVDYLETLRNDPDVLRIMQLPAYPKGTLEMVQACLTELRQHWQAKQTPSI